MFSLRLLNLLAWSEFAVSAPVSVSENVKEETTNWRSEPSTRGTFRLIFSCLTTLTICVYTAVHLNVPKKGTTRVARYTRKTGWVLLGIFAPEFVVYTAWAQWYSARKLLVEINKKIEEKNKSIAQDSSSNLQRWTMRHSFYAVMGGFVIDTKPTDAHDEYIPGSPRLTVTSRGIDFLALNGIFPQEQEEFITDKSKANAFAKILACLQGSWIIIQCIVRLRAKLPITLLEINTVGHVLCALAIFGFWFPKPLDIDEPTVIHDEDVHPLCALMWMSSSVSTDGIKRHPRSNRRQTELRSLLFHPGIRGLEGDSVIRVGPSTVNVIVPPADNSLLKIGENEIPCGTKFSLNPDSFRFRKYSLTSLERRKNQRGVNEDIWDLPKVIELDSTDLKRWAMASEALASRPIIFEAQRQNPLGSFLMWEFKELACDRARDWPGNSMVGNQETMLQDDRFNWMSLFLIFATAVYGGLHAAAWNGYFPTKLEKQIWRYSSITISASGSVLILGMTAIRVLDPLVWKMRRAKTMSDTLFTSFLIAFIAMAAAFIFSRSFIVIEAIISLRKLPVAAYDTPHWLQDFPHI